MKRRYFADLRDHVESWEADHYYETNGARIGRARRAWWFARCVALRLRLRCALLYCQRFGHAVEHEEFIAAERDARGRITDIDGAGVEWHCTRCGCGGHSWF